MAGFNPLNEKLKKQYEINLIHARHRDQRTAHMAWKAITLFENFTGRHPFTNLNADQAKGFRQWLMKQPNQKEIPMSLGTIRTTLANVREFFTWLHFYTKEGKKINPQAISYFHLSNNDDRAARASKPRQTPTVEQFKQAVAAMPHATPLELRDRALMALVCITGVRDAALVSLRMKDIDPATRTMWQDPKHVKTKFRKGITTAFVPVDPWLENVVVEWLEYARTKAGLEDNDPVFPQTLVEPNPETLTFEVKGLSKKPWANAAPVRSIFKQAFENAGLPYFHPHTARHMLVNWGMENLNQEEFKALSQNLGHEHCMTTYNQYGSIQPTRQIKLLRNVGKRDSQLGQIADADLLAELMRRKS